MYTIEMFWNSKVTLHLGEINLRHCQQYLSVVRCYESENLEFKETTMSPANNLLTNYLNNQLLEQSPPLYKCVYMFFVVMQGALQLSLQLLHFGTPGEMDPAPLY